MNCTRRGFLAAAGFAGMAALCALGPSAVGATHAEKLRAVLDSGDRDYVFVTMHRGDWRNYPENSRDAINGSIAKGADIVELDVCRTKDGRFVLLHDRKLDRVTNGKGKVADRTLAEIKKLRLKDGQGGKNAKVTDYEVLSLEEAFDIARGKILINIDKFRFWPTEILECVKRCGMEKYVILKGEMSPEQVKKTFGGSWKDVMDGTLCFMPIIWINKDGAMDKFNAWQTQARKPHAYELCFKDEKPIDVLEALAKDKATGPRIWINTLWDSLCAGHTDERGHGGDAEGSWGWCLRKGATMIQTDRPEDCLKYLKSAGRRNLDAAYEKIK